MYIDNPPPPRKNSQKFCLPVVSVGVRPSPITEVVLTVLIGFGSRTGIEDVDEMAIKSLGIVESLLRGRGFFDAFELNDTIPIFYCERWVMRSLKQWQEQFWTYA